MGTTARTIGLLTILLCGVATALAFIAPALAFEGPAQPKGGAAKPAPAAGKQAPAKSPDDDTGKDKDKAAQNAARLLDAGVKAYQSGDTKQAVRAFDTALQGGTLNHQQMAHALYYRGLCHRKDSKPGLAISDLTAAIWLKDGLTPGEKTDAMRHRVAAYQEAGIGDVPDFAPPPDSGAPVATASTAPGSAPASAPPPGGWQTGAGGSTASAPAATASSGPSGGVTGFFSSIGEFFTGGSSGSSTASTPAPMSTNDVTTASLAEPKPVSPAVGDSWSDTVKVAPAGQASSPASGQASSQTSAQTSGPAQPLPWSNTPPQQVAAAPAPAPPPAPSSQPGESLPWAAAKSPAAAAAPAPAEKPVVARTPSGKFQLQVASVRTRGEAEMLVTRLQREHGGELGGRDPQVDQSVIGNMGTFYRVRVGPYADAGEPGQLCNTLRGGGFDCLVVKN